MYYELSENHRVHIRREHVLNLEVEHYRLQLALAEEKSDDGRAAVIGRIVECERRIAVHVGEAFGEDPALESQKVEELPLP